FFGVRQRVWASADAGGSPVLGLAFSFCCCSICHVPLRYVQGHGLWFGSGECSAAEEMWLQRFLSFLWGFGEEVEWWRVVAVGGSLRSSGGGTVGLCLVLGGSLP
ncbi:unnamed protein product, partial [Brassica oleracea]